MTSPSAAPSQAVIRLDRVLVLSSLFGITALAWLVTLYISAGMDMMMPSDLVLTLALWLVMMVAMMTPSVSPTLLMYTSILRSRAPQPNRTLNAGPRAESGFRRGVGAAQRPFVLAGAFLFGYLLVWSGFSIAAAVAQSGLHDTVSSAALAGGAVLVAAGVFQFTPLKHACLSRCRSPQGFFITEWREGARGALSMGLKHGAYCLGCCWLLMSLLFVTGAMNIFWMAVLAIYVLVEKVVPAGIWLSRAAGLVLVGAGVWMVVGRL
jgi:predicted metal-binding membrane protein